MELCTEGHHRRILCLAIPQLIAALASAISAKPPKLPSLFGDDCAGFPFDAASIVELELAFVGIRACAVIHLCSVIVEVAGGEIASLSRAEMAKGIVVRGRLPKGIPWLSVFNESFGFGENGQEQRVALFDWRGGAGAM